MNKITFMALMSFVTSSYAVVNYDEFSEDEATPLIGSKDSPSASGEAPKMKPRRSSAPTSPSGGSSSMSSSGRRSRLGISPRVAYSQVSRNVELDDNGDGVNDIVPVGAYPTPVKLSSWNLGLDLPMGNEGAGISASSSYMSHLTGRGQKSEISNPRVDITLPWMHDRGGDGGRVDFLAAGEFPRRGGRYASHDRWDYGGGMGTGKRIFGLNLHAEGMYMIKKDNPTSSYRVGDEIIARASIGFMITEDVIAEVEGSLRRAFALKDQYNRTLISMARLSVIKPSLAFHVSPSIDLVASGILPVNTQEIQGREQAFGNFTIDGLMGNQVSVGMALRM